MSISNITKTSISSLLRELGCDTHVVLTPNFGESVIILEAEIYNMRRINDWFKQSHRSELMGGLVFFGTNEAHLFLRTPKRVKHEKFRIRDYI